MRRYWLMGLWLFVLSVHADNDRCDMRPGYADSHVLALSWQPGFCEVSGYESGKPECRQLHPQSHAAHHLVLHGLWPNQKACGIHYGFCGADMQKHHCDYSPLAPGEQAAEALRTHMPSFAAGSCLERHEWNKHGTCQDLDVDAYFLLATRLVAEADATEIGDFFRAHAGEQVTLEALKAAIAAALGEHAASAVPECTRGVLVEIRIMLPAVLNAGAHLADLLDTPRSTPARESCPRAVRIPAALASGGNFL